MSLNAEYQMHRDKMKDSFETGRLVLFPYTKENLRLFNTDLEAFEREFGVSYRGEELDYLLTGFLKKLEQEIAEDEENYLFFTEFLIVLKESDRIIGSIDYKYVPKDGTTEVGYGLNPAYWGNGYMTEALTAFLEFGKGLGIKRVLADTEKSNIASQRVLQKCGFTFLKEEKNLWWERNMAFPYEIKQLPEISLELKDTEWPYNGINAERNISRAIVVDDEGFFWFVRAFRNDHFGYSVFMETSGGGVEPGESNDEAIVRELKEELGAETEIICKIGVVSDYYNLLQRHNLNNYYLCRAKSFGEKHLMPDEIEDFHLTSVRCTYEEAVAEYEKRAVTRFGRLVAARELPILRRAGEILGIENN